MIPFRFVRVAAVALCALGAAPPVSAQPALTEDEAAERFRLQRELGPTRGLAIAPSSQPTVRTDAGTEVSLTQMPRDSQVNVNVVFDFDSAALREDQKPKLMKVCSAIDAAEVQRMRIIGHTDASGSADYNERLSLLRAVEVKRFIVRECGIPEDQLEAVGLGERFPYDEADPRADVNRRVEFQALG